MKILYRLQLNLLKLAKSKHRYNCPYRYFAHAKSLTSSIINISILIIVYAARCSAQHAPWSLKECIDTGIQRNIEIKQQEVSAGITKINLKQARDNLFPSLELTDAPGYNFGKTETMTGGYVPLNTSSNALALTGTVTLYNGMQLQNAIRENDYNYQSNMQTVEVTRNNLSLNILTAYMQVLSYYEGVDIAQSQIASDSQQVEETRIDVMAGKYPILNLLQIQSTLANDRLAKVNAGNQVIIAKVNLMQLMNLPVDYSFEIVRPVNIDSILSVTPLTTGGIYNIAAGILPQVKAAELNTKANESGLEAAKSLYYPKLTLSGSIRSSATSLEYIYNYPYETIGFLDANPALPVEGPVAVPGYSNTGSNLWNQMNDNYNQFIGLNLIIPIFTNFTARNSVAIAKLQVQNAQLNEQSVDIALRQSIEQAYTALLAAAQQYHASKEAFISEARTFSDMTNKYKVGLGSATDYLVEEANYTKAQQNVVQSKYNYLLQVKLLDYYMGKSIIF